MTGPAMMLKALGIQIDPEKLRGFIEVELPALVRYVRDEMAETRAQLTRIEAQNTKILEALNGRKES